MMSQLRIGFMFMSLMVLVGSVGAQEAGVATAPTTQAAGKDLPEGRAVLDAFVEATGGKTMLTKIKSTMTKAEMEMPALGVKADLTITQIAPNRSYFIANMPGIGEVVRYTDGKSATAWETHPLMGARLIEGEELTAALRDADLLAPLHPEKYYKSIECVGEVAIDGRPCYQVESTLNDGGVETTYYDKDSKLLVRVERSEKTPMGDVKTLVDMTDYRDVGGMKFPHKSTLDFMNQKQVITVKSIELDGPIDESAFAPPPEIKELMDKDAAEAKSEAEAEAEATK